MSAIEGIPDGYELARIGAPKKDEPYLTPGGKIDIAEGNFEGTGYAVLRKIEKPKQFRPFANAAEFGQHWGKPVNWKGNGELLVFYAVTTVNDVFCWVAFGTVSRHFDWNEAFEKLVFSDGTPFGVEVTK